MTTDWLPTNGRRPDLPEGARVEVRVFPRFIGYEGSRDAAAFEGWVYVESYRLASPPVCEPAAPRWRPCSEPPRVAGVYRRRGLPGGLEFQRWDSHQWLGADYTAAWAATACQRSAYQSGEWLDTNVGAEGNGGPNFLTTASHEALAAERCPPSPAPIDQLIDLMAAAQEEVFRSGIAGIKDGKVITAEELYARPAPRRDRFGLRYSPDAPKRPVIAGFPASAMRGWK